MNNKWLLWIVIMLSMTVPAKANLIVPLAMETIPFYPIFLLIEIPIFWVFARKVFDIDTTWKTIIGSVALANIVSSFAGVFFVLPTGGLTTLIPYFILTMIIEYLIVWAFYRHHSNKADILYSVFLMNSVSYAIFVLLTFG
ncbi:MAG: hypothetical protein ACMXYL_05340 [Candidatus Woesearchaeota archaeon]